MSRFLNILVCIATAVFLTTSALIFVVPHPDRSPTNGITFDPEASELGELRQNDSVEITLQLQNQTSKQYVVRRIMPSCHCTHISGVTSGTVLEPRSSSPIHIEFRTGQATGTVSSRVVVEASHGNDVVTTQVTVSGRVEPEYTTSRDYIDFGITGSADSDSVSLELIPAKDPDVSIVRAECTGTDFTAAIASRPGYPARDVFVRFSPASPAAAGVRTGSLFLHTSSARCPTVSIPIRALLRPVVQISPHAVVLSHTEPSQTITIEASNSEHLLLVSCDTDTHTLECEWDASLDSPEQTLTITLRVDDCPPATSASHTLHLVMSVNNDRDPLELSVPVSILGTSFGGSS